MSRKILLIVFFIGLVLTSCDDFFEKDLSDSTVVILSPADGSEIAAEEIQFWWDHISGSTDYQLQLVSPGFDSPERLLIDTSLIDNKLLIQNIDTGNYQWRVRAFNYSSSTDYTLGSFHFVTD